MLKVLGSFLFLAFVAQCQVVVKVPGIGTLVGSVSNTSWTNQTIYQFLGVKYAKSPNGEKRYKSPEPSVTGFEYMHIVNEYGRPCPTYKELSNLTEEQLKADVEDCLHMSIYTKNLTGKYPVMVFIHGGSMRSGSSKKYPPNFLLEKDIVYISIQYRLGPLGFISTQTNEIPGNAGLLDIILGLQFIKAYIKFFGGNPDQITLFGQSSGAAIVSSMIVNPRIPADLFHRAILQSGSYFSPFAFEENPLMTTQQLLSYTNCPKTDNIAHMNWCLMNTKPMELLKADDIYYNDHLLNGKSPWTRSRLVKSDILPVSPTDCLLSNATMKNISLMAGVTKHDGVFAAMIISKYLNQTQFYSDQKYNSYNLLDKLLIDYLGIGEYTGTVRLYLESFLFGEDLIARGNISEMLNPLKDLTNTVGFKAPTFMQARLMSKDYPQQTYLYTFDYLGECSMMSDMFYEIPSMKNEVHHSDECIYLFPIFNLNAKDTTMAKTMVDLWTSFAITGIPKSSQVSHWPPFSKFSGPYLHIDRKSWVGNNFLDEFSIVTRETNQKLKLNSASRMKNLSYIVLLICLYFTYIQ